MKKIEIVLQFNGELEDFGAFYQDLFFKLVSQYPVIISDVKKYD